ncbi:sulfate/molybdate ABC transporter ATP-binding protein [Alkalihalobacterium chitinilyticum]|uniref:Sulfate/molybdate ABC transporter ATP-binding protein n=1 Tax=Alkalihalobacterium chitinilyticum TaxID=2980103 RepID=A0ABT5VDH0_9BACI|nr:sulfate/molybdate ABC transporter ATP-binding protein [Alkalihalobacterium chitinilyticum]MDE5413372.1 sulfate/molybdate ABC transporter ATP-binding protein [Alkalihalobacterium chitinilyticum]
MLDVIIQKQLDTFALDVSFQAEKGITAILGPSGCGKSLTLQCLAGLHTPDNGKIVLHDRTLFDANTKTRIKTRHRNIGYVFQNYALFPHLTVKENIAFGLKKSHNKREIEEKVAAMIAKIHLEGYEQHYPRQLSGGQQQRVALGRTLITNPDLLLLDEPFSALDHHVKHMLEQELLTIIQENFSGVVLLVTHNMEEAYRLADRILLLKQGKVIQFGEKQELFQRPRSVAAAQIIGCKNVIPVSSVDKRNGEIEVSSGELRLIVSNNEPSQLPPTHVGIHAENIEFVSEAGPAPNAFEFEIGEMISGINQTLVSLRVGILDLRAVVPNNRLQAALTSKKVLLPPEHLFLLH